MNRIVEKVVFSIPKQPKAKRVAAYARVSSSKDAMKHIRVPRTAEKDFKVLSANAELEI